MGASPSGGETWHQSVHTHVSELTCSEPPSTHTPSTGLNAGHGETTSKASLYTLYVVREWEHSRVGARERGGAP